MKIHYITRNDNVTPAKALAFLEEGNARFVANKMTGRDWLQLIAKTASGRYPFAIVLGCIDSRVPVEVVFDQGIGDLFVARVAGNVLNDDMLGSMEFACQVVGASLIVVLGHTRCGAVRGAIEQVELGHFTGLLAKIEPAVKQAKVKSPDHDADELMDEVTRLNVDHVAEEILEKSSLLNQMVRTGKVGLVKAVYDVDSGRVTFI